MSEFHSLGVTLGVESVDPQFVREGLMLAREHSWTALGEVRARVRAGMTETQAREMAYQTLAEMGATKNWHKPWVRFGPGTTLSFYDNVQPDYRLQDGDPVYVDLGPVWADEKFPIQYEGDVGDTFVFGENAEAQKCIEASHQIWREARDWWLADKPTGRSLYGFLKRRTAELGYVLLEKVDGHRLADFPHIKYSKESLGDVTFPPAADLWILELQILHPNLKLGAFFEDLLQ